MDKLRITKVNGKYTKSNTAVLKTSTSSKQLNLVSSLSLLLKDYSPEQVRAAVINLWAQFNDIQIRDLSKGYISGRYLDHLSPSVLKSLFLIGLESCSFSSIAQVAAAFEAIFSSEHRRLHGVVYTPPFIAKYLIREGMTMTSSFKEKNFGFCDPCCGGAVFQIAAAEVLYEEQQINFEDSFQNHIWGFDRDPVALSNAQCLIELFLAIRSRPLPSVRLNFHECDFFDTDASKFLDSIGVSEGFHLIATNPPYVKLQNLPEEYRAKLVAKYNGLANGSFSLAMLFPIAAQQFLGAAGCLAFITQNNLFTSLAGVEVRRELQFKRSIRRIIDFGHNKVFDNASAYTCLMFLTKSENEVIEFDSIRQKITQETLTRTRFSKIAFETLKSDKWRLASERDMYGLKRIENVGVPLGELASIRVGFATLKDRVFLVEKVNGKCLAQNLKGLPREIEIEITRPAIKIACFDSETELRSNRLRIIFPYKQVKGKFVLMSEIELKSEYPKAYGYLEECRAILATRDKGKASYDEWYAWGRTQGTAAPGPKLLTKTFSRGPNFLMDESDSLFCNGYAVFQPQPSLFGAPISIRALQRVLNSSVMHYYARLTSFQIEGGFECYQKNFIERFGIPQFSQSEDKDLVSMEMADANIWLAHKYGLDPSYLSDFFGNSKSGLGPDDELRAYSEDQKQILEVIV